MKRLKRAFVLALLACLLLAAVMVQAQEVTSEAPVVVSIEPESTPVVVPPGSTVIVQADDTPPVIQKDENPVLLVVIVVLLVVLVLTMGFVLFLAHKGFNMLPPWAQELIRYNQPFVEGEVDTGFDTLDRMAVLTPNTLDDLLVKYGREFVERKVKEFYGELPPAGARATSPPAPPTPAL